MLVLVGAFLFTGDDVFKQCRDLSGGQRNRLMLCRLVLTEPDVLILDEPTNHLDIASREMLEKAMSSYTGTIIAVSHDRYFLNQIVDKLLVIGTDELGHRCLGQTEFVGGKPAYTVYAALVRQRNEAEKQKQQTRPNGARKRNNGRNDKAKPRPTTPEELKRFNKYSVEQIEEMIMSLEEQIAEMKEHFGDEAIYKDPAQLAELQRNYDANVAELDLLYRAYDRRSG